MAFEEITIPYMDRVRSVVRRAAEQVPSIGLAGWDVAISQDGPVILEGNADYHLGMMEIANGGYLRDQRFRDGPWRRFRPKRKLAAGVAGRFDEGCSGDPG